MEITIIGTGSMARGIATRALAGGHAVTPARHRRNQGVRARRRVLWRRARRDGR
jgi:3-hydroxyisobutyrate dehydrogenase-like beta-hydroxyacid dehydrogenase